MSAALLQQWQLPEAIIEPVRYHTDKLSSAPDEFIADTAVVHSAAIIARGAMWQADEDEPVPEFDQLAVTMLGIDDESTKACMTEADSAVVEAMTLLLPNAKNKIPKAK